MKKIMILGSVAFLIPVVKRAKELGYYVITTDYLPDGYAHKYSDEFCNCSIIDKEAVLHEAERRGIDGILTFACDSGTETVAYVQEKMKLPQIGPYESVRIMQNKGRFREFLARNGFNCPIAKAYKDPARALDDISIFKFPVIVKPVDSAGSKGVSKVDCVDSLCKSIQYALSFSRSNEFIIEEFIEPLYNPSDSECFSVDGKLTFASFSCQMFDKGAKNPYTPSAFSWPSSFSQEQIGILRDDIQRVIRLLHMNTTIYNCETRIGVDGKPYIMELSPRGGGNRLAEMIYYATGVDLITASINAAVGNPVSEVTEKPLNGNWSEIIVHSNSEGLFRELEIGDELKPFIKDICLWIKSGERITAYSNATHALGTIILKFPSKEMMDSILRDATKYYSVNTVVE